MKSFQTQGKKHYRKSFTKRIKKSLEDVKAKRIQHGTAQELIKKIKI